MANYATYPFKNQRITQNYNGKTSHYSNVTGKNYRDYPIDEAGKDTGKEACYPPCDEIIIKRIYGVGNRGTNTVFFESTGKVKFADGTEDYLCGLCIHTSDSDLKALKVGQKIKRNQVFLKEGTDGGGGKTVGMHLHMSFGKGKLKGNGWIANSNGTYVLYCTGGTFKPEQILYIDRTFTKVISSGGLTFKDKPKDVVSSSATKPNTTSFFPSRGYFKKGDESPNIGKITKFMRKVFPAYTSKNALGNIYNSYAVSAITEFQKRTGLTPDGLIGDKTVAKLEAYGFKK